MTSKDILNLCRQVKKSNLLFTGKKLFDYVTAVTAVFLFAAPYLNLISHCALLQIIP